MGLFKRISNLLRSNVNDLLDRAEDPEKTLNQVIRDMEQCLRDAKIQVCRTIKHKKKLESTCLDYQEQIVKWQKNAELAITKGDDELARQALIKKQSFSSMTDSLGEQLEKQTRDVDTLKSRLEELVTKIDEYKRRRDVLAARQKNAEAQKMIQETLSGISDPSLFEAFDQLEDRISSMERQNEALEELSASLPPGNLEVTFEKLRNEDSEKNVNQELEELKERLKKKGAV